MRKPSNSNNKKVNIMGPKRRYTLLPSPPPQPNTSENSNYFSSTSTPIPVRISQSPSHITRSPITYSPPVFQRPYQPSPIRAVRETKVKPRKKNKTRRVKIFKPRKSERRPKTQTQVQTEKLKERSRKLETQKVAQLDNQPLQKVKKHKSIKVDTGTVNLQVCYPILITALLVDGILPRISF